MTDHVRVQPSDGANAWGQGFGASGAKYQRGVQNVKDAPNAKAAAALPRWIASVTSKAVQDKFVARNNAVTLESWKKSTIEYGVQNLSRGATKGAPKYQAFAGSFYPHLDAGLAKVSAMPNVTLQDRISRAVAMMQHNATFKRT